MNSKRRLMKIPHLKSLILKHLTIDILLRLSRRTLKEVQFDQNQKFASRGKICLKMAKNDRFS